MKVNYNWYRFKSGERIQSNGQLHSWERNSEI